MWRRELVAPGRLAEKLFEVCAAGGEEKPLILEFWTSSKFPTTRSILIMDFFTVRVAAANQRAEEAEKQAAEATEHLRLANKELSAAKAQGAGDSSRADVVRLSAEIRALEENRAAEAAEAAADRARRKEQYD